ncbi:hypothetical protein E4T56_gene13900 [Termitomyces sp. T112]|nr:hypothetical protein E4T56_gene13900 [Termitomyces sp. T112]
MQNPSVNEETPLLLSPSHGTAPIPWSQFSIVLWIQLVEPLSTQVISPFARQLIRDIGITRANEAHAGYYIGILHSVFYMVQVVTVLHWGRISDHIGRKPYF